MIPDIQPLKLSVLCCCKNGEIKIRDAIETLANEYELTEDERKELNPSGSGKFKGRVRWAKYSLVKDGLIESTRKGHFKITHRGLEYLNEDGEKVNGDGNLDEDLRIVHNKIKESLQADILDKVRVVDPTFFEFLIIKLLRRMGYGGTAEDSGKVIGKSGDNGVDGVIDQDPLGVDQIYIQAKRYAKENSVSSGDIRNFFGALNLKKAQKGIGSS
ncbi:MAG: restriction endonuclease [Gammaproteobacteria bacterium]|nr:restriction endonuclease [Gammaproteobacteria bacterium]